MILLRHAESEFNEVFNVSGVDPGIEDPKLTGRGHRQAREAVAELIQYQLSRILASPYTRTLQTAEIVAHRFGISRWQMDNYAMESHHRLAKAQEEGWLNDEVEPMFAPDGTVYDHDDGVRPDSSVESLAKLKPVFKREGTVTAGNASGLNDAAAAVLCGE